MIHWILNFLYPPKCVLCRKVLSKSETDYCNYCRIYGPEYTKSKSAISFLAGWTTVWYYTNDVRKSILRYKFGNKRSYAAAYGRSVGMKIIEDLPSDIDFITWIPVSKLRKIKRGFDQVELLATAVSKEIPLPLKSTLKKIRNTRAQSTLSDESQRKANVLGAYKVLDADLVKGKRILLLDDVLTTGSTASECAKTLLLAGAKDVYFASVAAAAHNKK